MKTECLGCGKSMQYRGSDICTPCHRAMRRACAVGAGDHIREQLLTEIDNE